MDDVPGSGRHGSAVEVADLQVWSPAVSTRSSNSEPGTRGCRSGEGYPSTTTRSKSRTPALSRTGTIRIPLGTGTAGSGPAGRKCSGWVPDELPSAAAQSGVGKLSSGA